MTDKPSPAQRMRQLLQSRAEEEQTPPPPLPTKPQASSSDSSATKSAAQKSPSGRGERILRAFWTLASIVSFTINLVLLITLLVLWQNRNAVLTLANTAGEGILGGLYGNFVKMDEAHIITNITVESEIPIQFDLPVATETVVTLTEPVKIVNAYVVISSPLLNISAPATVTLPEGTRLPIALSINVPVDTTVPVHLEVPVDIPLEETDLHDPFVGLQNVLKPYYCLLMPQATLWDGRPVCLP